MHDGIMGRLFHIMSCLGIGADLMTNIDFQEGTLSTHSFQNYIALLSLKVRYSIHFLNNFTILTG